MNEFSATPLKIIKSDEQDELNIWTLPTVQEQSMKSKKTKTNVFGHSSQPNVDITEKTENIDVTPLTAEDIESIQQAAHEEGFNQGKEEGFTKGYEEGKAKGIEDGALQGKKEGLEAGLAEGKAVIEEQTEQWKMLIEQLQVPLANVEKNVEEQLLNLVVQLTEAVVLQESKTNPDILMSAISTGIKALPSNEAQTQIHLNPDDIKLVEQQFGAEHISKSGWRLLPAPQLSQGSCQIENSTSNIDLQMKSRLRQVLESFLQDALHQ